MAVPALPPVRAYGSNLCDGLSSLFAGSADSRFNRSGKRNPIDFSNQCKTAHGKHKAFARKSLDFSLPPHGFREYSSSMQHYTTFSA